MALARWLIAALSLIAAPATASVDPVLVASLRDLAARDLRIASVAYRLQTASVAHCSDHMRLSGLIVQDASQYRGDLRSAVASVFGLRTLPTVISIVAGSAGDRAGLRAGDAIEAINGADFPEQDGAIHGEQADGERFAAIVDRLDDAFQKGEVHLRIRRSSETLQITMTGDPACRSDVQLDLGQTRNAHADGRTISVTQGLLDFTRSDDELAFAIGHELAHNILKHHDYLESTRTSHGLFRGLGSNGRRLRETERQADYWGIYLVAWAGYDPHAAAIFWRRMVRTHSLTALLSDGTHPGNGGRTRDLQCAANRIDAARAAGRPLVPDFLAFDAQMSKETASSSSC